jgi:hypothetical protein
LKRVRALLDRPSHESFGMTPLVIEDGDQLHVHGLAPASAHRAQPLSTNELDELLRGGHGLGVDQELRREPAPNAVALWLGDSFSKRAEALLLPPAPLPAAFQAAGGRFFVGPAPAMFPYLERWIVGAFRRFRREGDSKEKKDIASLMRWVLPQRPESLAAAWSSAAKADRELEFQLRAFARGRSTTSLKAEHERLLGGPDRDPDELSHIRLVLFTGRTGVEREKVARRFAKRFVRDQLGAFRPPITRRVGELSNLDYAASKWILADEGQAEVETSPLALALEAIRTATPFDNTLVLDGLRHSKIRSTFDWLGPRRVFVVAVEADEALMRERVASKHVDPDRLFRHPTEEEIPELTKKADRRVGETAGDNELQEIFDAL